MSKTILYIAMSLDGYVADSKGGVNWLQGDGSNPESMGSYPAFYESIDTVVLGYATYKQIREELSPDKWVYADKRCYVVTSRNPEEHDDISFTSESPKSLVTRLKAEGSGNIWICGGAALAQSLIASRLVDEYRISIIPTILGGGIPLFKENQEQLRLTSSSHSNGIVELCYVTR